MDFLPQVVRASYERAFRLRLTFKDGIEASVDFQGWFTAEVFEPLKKVSYFKKFFIDGGTVVWPNGADIAPETLNEAATRSNLALQPTPAGTRRRRG